jgi:hypothetical protein
MKYILIWVVLTLTSQGPTSGEVRDSTDFNAEADCKSFADANAKRMEDWVRGNIGAGWEHPVGVEYVCRADGQPT